MSAAARTLHLAAAQVHSGGGVDDVLRRMERQIRAAAAVGVEVILFAEGVLQGYDYTLTPEGLARLAEPADGPACDRVSALAQEHGMAVIAGFYERDGADHYNAALVARPDGSRAVQRKHYLTGGEKKAGFRAGPAARSVFEFGGVRCAVMICADGSIENLDADLRAKGVEYRLCPTGGGGKMREMIREADLDHPQGREAYVANRPRVHKTEAILSEEDCPYAGFTSANALGPVGEETCHQGHCMIVDNRRVMRAQIPGTIVLEHQQDQMIHAALTF